MANPAPLIAAWLRAVARTIRPALLIPAIIIGAALVSVAMQGDTVADRVLGQVDLMHNSPNLVDSSGMWSPLSLAIDSSVTPNRLYVSDYANSRVLGYKDVATFVNGGAADLVLGQPDFVSGQSSALSFGCNSPSDTSLCDPIGVAVDPSGNLYVADSDNARVVEYNTPFAGCGSFPCVGGPANLVFGQGGNFNSNTCDLGGASASTLCLPSGVAVDSHGNLFVADQDDNRVLEYNTPLTTDTVADEVFGQGGSFSSTSPNNGGLSSTSLYGPNGVALDPAGNLYIADSINHRVLEYNNPLTNTTADEVFGQAGSFTSKTPNNGGVSASSLSTPYAVAFEPSGELYIVDAGNNRVLEYSSPLTNATANHVFGQGGSFTSTACNSDTGNSTIASANDLCLLGFGGGVASDGSGNLYVADSGNNRVLEYNAPLTNSTANVVLGQLNFVDNGDNLIDARGFDNPQSVAIDTSTTPNRLYVSDGPNSPW